MKRPEVTRDEDALHFVGGFLEIGGPETRIEGGEEVPVKNIYVGNLDLRTSAESIRSFFEPFGTVHKIKLMLDIHEGRQKVHGLASFPHVRNDATQDHP